LSVKKIRSAKNFERGKVKQNKRLPTSRKHNNLANERAPGGNQGEASVELKGTDAT